MKKPRAVWPGVLVRSLRQRKVWQATVPDPGRRPNQNQNCSRMTDSLAHAVKGGRAKARPDQKPVVMVMVLPRGAMPTGL